MGAALRIVDETPSGRVLGETTLRLVSEKLTVRQLIEARVRHEVAAFNADQEERVFRGLVRPTETEAHLNGYRLKKGRHVDPDEQVTKALDAFGRNGFLLLVDDKQLEALTDEIVVTDATAVSFIKLIPLVGG